MASAARLLYRGYRIGDLVEHGSFPAVANLLWTDDWDPTVRMATAPVPPAVMTVLRALPTDDEADGRAPDRRLGVGREPDPGLPADRRAGPGPDRRLAVRAGRVRPAASRAWSRSSRTRTLDLVEGFLYQLNGVRPGSRHGQGARCVLHRRRRARLQRLDVHGPGHHVDPQRPRVGRDRRDRHDEGPAPRWRTVRGGGPARPGGLAEHAEQWLRDALDRDERLMGFGHRVYRAYDPRAAALRKVVEAMPNPPDWLQLAIEVEDVALRVLAERYPDRPLKTNVEYYAAPCSRASASPRTCSRRRSRWPAMPAGRPTPSSRPRTTA